MTMKVVVFMLVFFAPYWCWSQKIDLIVPTQPVVIGSAFQVQYVITNPLEIIDISTPRFDSCRLISGPNIYMGNAVIQGKLQPIQNIAYTLIPSKTGVLKIGSIRVDFKNLPDQQSKEAGITVVPQPKASFSVRSSYTDANLYIPSVKEDREKLIRENLFIRIEVDKKQCYEGEPVVVSFKLYSRLQSSSEAEKSPAFYGFSVVDMLNINEAHTAVEKTNGKVFNTSVLRQVQLYPIQAGQRNIDEMYVENQIEFQDSNTHVMTKVENEIITAPVTISVLPLPEKKPEDFTGAVGNFSMDAHLERKEIPLNGQGKLVIRIKGTGNFIQFGQPFVNWPQHLELFEPTIKEQLNKSVAPIEGARSYEIPFTADSIGNYTILPFSFSYFDVKARAFKQVYSDSLKFTIINSKEKTVASSIREKVSGSYPWLTLALAIAFAVAIIIWYQFKKKNPKPLQAEPKLKRSDALEQIISLNMEELNEKQTCLEIQKTLSLFSSRYSSSLSIAQKKQLQSILDECQLCIYSHLEDENKKESIRAKAIRFLQSV